MVARGARGVRRAARRAGRPRGPDGRGLPLRQARHVHRGSRRRGAGRHRLPQEARELSRRGQALFQRVTDLSLPVVAAIHGACVGGGLEFALACSFRVASDADETRLGFPEVQLGIIPAWGGTQRAARLLVARGRADAGPDREPRSGEEGAQDGARGQGRAEGAPRRGGRGRGARGGGRGAGRGAEQGRRVELAPQAEPDRTQGRPVPGAAPRRAALRLPLPGAVQGDRGDRDRALAGDVGGRRLRSRRGVRAGGNAGGPEPDADLPASRGGSPPAGRGGAASGACARGPRCGRNGRRDRGGRRVLRDPRPAQGRGPRARGGGHRARRADRGERRAQGVARQARRHAT